MPRSGPRGGAGRTAGLQTPPASGSIGTDEGMPGMLDVEWVESEAEVAASLWAQCFPPPFEGRWWYRALERSGLQDQFRFFYAQVYDTRHALALAPAFLMDVPLRLVAPESLATTIARLERLAPSLLQQRTLFIGSPCSDEGRVGLLPGVERLPVLRALDRALRRQARVLGARLRVWKDFPAAYASDFAQLARTNGLFPAASFPGSVVDLPGPDKAAYLASLKSSRRNKLKKKLRLSAPFRYDIEALQHPDAATLDALFALFWQTYEKGATQFERLTPAFFTEIATCDVSHFIILREPAGGRAVAFMLCFLLGEHVINKFIGLDYTQPRESFLYFRLWDAAVDWALTQGATSIQSGQTGYAPKIELGHRLLPLTNYSAHRNPLVHRLYAWGARHIDWSTLDPDLATWVRSHGADGRDGG